MKTYLFGLIALVLAFTVTEKAHSYSKLAKKELVAIHCEIDLSKGTNGAVGAKKVCDLPDAFIVAEAIVNVDTALVGGGTLVVGEDGAGDADGYWTDLDAVTGVLKCSGALCASGKAHQVAPALDGVQITIATTAYTAGVLKFSFIGYQGE